MEYLEDYDFDLHYLPGKANVVTDALSQNPQGIVASLYDQRWKMVESLYDFDLYIGAHEDCAYLCNLVTHPTLIGRIIEAQDLDSMSEDIRTKITTRKTQEGWSILTSSGLRYLNKFYVPNISDIRNEVLRESHHSPIQFILEGQRCIVILDVIFGGVV